MDNYPRSGNCNPESNGHNDLDARIAQIEAQFTEVPATLKKTPNWIVWKFDEVDGRPEKVPYQPHRPASRAMVNVPSTWSTFETTVETLARHPEFEGPGTVFTDDDSYAGIDIDKCRDAESGEMPSWVTTSVKNTGTYAEISPSGTGVKLWGIGSLPSPIGAGRHPNKIEAYNRGRWFAVTGRKLPEATSEVRNIQQALDRVWGDVNGSSGGDYPEAMDVAAAMEGVSEGERNTMIFRLASRYRRTDLPLDDAIYLIRRTAGRCNPPYSAELAEGIVRRVYNTYPPTKLVPDKIPDDFLELPSRGLPGRRMVGEAIRDGIEPPAMLVENFLYKGKTHAWGGPPGVGKSILALWLSIKVMNAGGRVLYLDEEGSLNMVSERLEALGADLDTLDERFFYYQAPTITLSGESLAALFETVEDAKPDLIVFDSWADFLALDGLDENSSMDITRWIKHISDPLKNGGATVLLLDHVNKEDSGRGTRGSTAKLAKPDVLFKIKLNQSFDRETIGQVTLIRDKDREAVLPRTTEFAIGGKGERIIVEPNSSVIRANLEDELTSVDREVLAALTTDGLRAHQWFLATGFKSKKVFYASRDKLVRQRVVTTEVRNAKTYYLHNTIGPDGPRPDGGGPGETGPDSNPPDRPNPADNAWSRGPETTLGPNETKGKEWSHLVSPPIGETKGPNQGTKCGGPALFNKVAPPADMKFKILGVIDALPYGTMESPTYPSPLEFHKAVAAKLGVTLDAILSHLEAVDGEYDWTGLFRPYSYEDFDREF